MSSAIPPGSLVLVTGINGYIGSHIADQLLDRGYQVRGTTRNLSKIKTLQALWEKKHGPNKVEFISVPDMTTEGAWTEAVKGVSGIAHVASDVSFGSDPNKVITPVIEGMNNLLRTAALSPTLKRFVYTSSSTGATNPIPGKVFTISSNTWNETAIKDAWAPPPYSDSRAWAVYAASKTQAEQALWKFVKEEKPGFVANSVLPNCNFGKKLDSEQSASTCGWLIDLYNGDTSFWETFPPQYHVDVRDNARVHVSALINPSVENERLFTFAEPFTVNDLLDILHKLRPDHKLPAAWTDPNLKDLSIVKNERCIQLLKEDWGQEGWIGIEESIKSNMEGL